MWGTGGARGWWPWALGAILLGLVAIAGVAAYRALDALYPQELWKYFRPVPPLGSGSILYRTTDGQLFLAPLADPDSGRRLLDTTTPPGTREVVRDAVALPQGQRVAYYASELHEGQAERDRVKVISLDGQVVRTVDVSAAGEPLRPAIFLSSSGRFLALTSRDRGHVYYLDLGADTPLTLGQPDAPPEPMLWTRNGDLRTPLLAGQRPFATSPDGKLRAQVREGPRRAPACLGEQPRCEAAQELVVSAATIAGAERPPVVLYGAFSAFSADGWGPIPTQRAERLYGRLVWSPDGTQLLFSALDGAEARTYAIGVDGKTRPRLILAAGEALDWLP